MSTYHVEVNGKKPYGLIDSQDYCIWSYRLSADPPLDLNLEAGCSVSVLVPRRRLRPESSC
jgi:hypothetical protein